MFKLDSYKYLTRLTATTYDKFQNVFICIYYDDQKYKVNF